MKDLLYFILFSLIWVWMSLSVIRDARRWYANTGKLFYPIFALFFSLLVAAMIIVVALVMKGSS